MRKLFVTLMLFLLLACSPPDETILEGVWQSNAEMSILTGNEKLTPEEINFLRENPGGDLHYSFRGNKTKIFTLNIPESEMKHQFFFQITEQTKDFVTFDIYEQFLFFKYSQQTVKFFFADDNENCFILSTESGYNEYFCRKNLHP